MTAAEIILPKSLRPIDVGDLVRLGGKEDGGYVVPERCVKEANALLSFGLSANWEFEKDFRSRNAQAAIHVYDRSVNKQWMRIYRAKSLIRWLLTGNRKCLLACRRAAGYSRFFDGKNATHYKMMVGRRDTHSEVCMDSIMKKIDKESRVLISMDIERSEYRVLGDCVPFYDRFLGMVVEYHDLDILREQFWNQHSQIVEKFVVAHLHVNNVGGLGPDRFPNVLEITYVHRELVGRELNVSSCTYPIAGLDYPNSEDLTDYSLTFEGN